MPHSGTSRQTGSHGARRGSGGGNEMSEWDGSDQVLHEEARQRISRRRVLKGMGAGAAIAWSAPVLSSVGAPAFAQETPVCTEPCDFVCGQEPQFCGEFCICDRTTEQDCFCLFADIGCEELEECKSSEDCPPGYRCAGEGCCGSERPHLCLPPCDGISAPRGAGRRFISR